MTNTVYNDEPLSDEDAATIKKLYQQYQEQQPQREQYRQQHETLPEIGRRKQ